MKCRPGRCAPPPVPAPGGQPASKYRPASFFVGTDTRRLKCLTFSDTLAPCTVNFQDEVAFLAVCGERESEEIGGSCCHFLKPSSNIAAVGYMVAQGWQGVGLGKALQQRMVEHAQQHGVRPRRRPRRAGPAQGQGACGVAPARRAISAPRRDAARAGSSRSARS